MNKKTVPALTKISEGKKIEELLKAAGISNEAEFARSHGIGKNGTMVYQHRKGITAISLAAAMAYAKALGVPISAFSDRLEKQCVAISNAPIKNPQPKKAPSTELNAEEQRLVDAYRIRDRGAQLSILSLLGVSAEKPKKTA